MWEKGQTLEPIRIPRPAIRHALVRQQVCCKREQKLKAPNLFNSIFRRTPRSQSASYAAPLSEDSVDRLDVALVMARNDQLIGG